MNKLNKIIHDAGNGELNRLSCNASEAKSKLLNWREGAHFVRATGNEYIGEQLYRVMHPGQAGGQCAFVLRIDTGEESLFVKSATDLREITDKEELSERIQEASFSNLMNSYANGDITLAIAMQAARIILHDGTNS